MLKVKKFLFCLELETGAVIIGYACIILSLLMGIVFLLASAFNFQEVLNFIKERVRQPNENLPSLRKLLMTQRNSIDN
jgi:ABC-type transport system involved in cytochrome c biogenesis permease subunit